MYIHYDPNPNHSASKKNDCVVRSISKALNKRWTRVYDELSSLGRRLGDWGCYFTVWGPYLRDYGFKKYTVPNYCPDCYTIADFARDNPAGSFLLATESHLVAVVDGDIYDAWDSSNEVPIFYLTKE